MKYDNNLNNSVTSEVLPKFENSRVSHTAAKDIECAAIVLRSRKVLDWAPSSDGGFSWISQYLEVNTPVL
jgi:hypothetical protein